MSKQRRNQWQFSRKLLMLPVLMLVKVSPSQQAWALLMLSLRKKSEPAVNAAKEAVPATVAAFVVKSKQLNVRKGPSTEEPVVRKLSAGDQVEALSCEKSWCKIAESEFVSEKFLKKVK